MNILHHNNSRAIKATSTALNDESNDKAQLKNKTAPRNWTNLISLTITEELDFP